MRRHTNTYSTVRERNGAAHMAGGSTEKGFGARVSAVHEGHLLGFPTATTDLARDGAPSPHAGRLATAAAGLCSRGLGSPLGTDRRSPLLRKHTNTGFVQNFRTFSAQQMIHLLRLLLVGVGLGLRKQKVSVRSRRVAVSQAWADALALALIASLGWCWDGTYS